VGPHPPVPSGPLLQQAMTSLHSRPAEKRRKWGQPWCNRCRPEHQDWGKQVGAWAPAAAPQSNQPAGKGLASHTGMRLHYCLSPHIQPVRKQLSWSSMTQNGWRWPAASMQRCLAQTHKPVGSQWLDAGATPLHMCNAFATAAVEAAVEAATEAAADATWVKGKGGDDVKGAHLGHSKLTNWLLSHSCNCPVI